MGCGIGCGVLILLGVIFGVGSVFFVKRTMRGFDEAITTRLELTQRFGETWEYVPPPDGAVPEERMRVFLAVRDSLSPMRERIGATFKSFAAAGKEIEQETSGLRKVIQGLKIGRSGLGLGGDLGEFFRVRNQALLDSEMGMGEYTYIYALAYYALLRHSPDDGPEDVFVDFDEEESSAEAPEGFEHWERSRHDGDRPYRRIRRDLLAILDNQLAELPPPGESAQADAWRQELRAEIDALAADPARVIWQDGLPTTIRASLAPYRDRLETSYSCAMNIFELSQNRKQGWSIRSE